MIPTVRYGALVLALAGLAACGGPDHEAIPEAAAAEPAGTPLIVRDTTVETTFDATGIAEPFAQATLSTKLMGTVTAVRVREGDQVRAGQILATIDARDLDARREQVRSGIAGAEAMHREAQLQADRMRALFADSAAARAQLDAAEAGLARAEAGVRSARATQSELDAVSGYSVIRAPFAGTITQRLVDPGAFAAPGSPLLTIQDQRRLRLAVNVTPQAATSLRRGAKVNAVIEGVETQAVVEGVVPTGNGSLYTLNATVDNAAGRFPSGGAATVHVPAGTHSVILVPASAVRTEGDLTGVRVRVGESSTTRWVRLGRTHGALVEVVSGLRAGETILLPHDSVQE
jgi:RND family efflux transporter MFP subunit